MIDPFLRFVGRIATMRARRRIGDHVDAKTIRIRTRDGLLLAAFLIEVEDAKGTVVLGHGYRDDRRQLMLLAPDLLAAGWRVLAIDFRAHGESEGDAISIGHDEAIDVEAALHHARGHEGEVVYVGFSMGAAAYLLYVKNGGDEADRAVLDAPYDTLREAIAVRLDWVKMRRFSGRVERLREGGARIDDVRPIDAVATLKRPTMIVFSAEDRWISETARRRFTEAAHGETRIHVVPRGGHDAHFDEGWRRLVTAFADRGDA